MISKRRSEAIWIDDRQRWQINVQRDGRRRTFTSAIPGRKGKHDAEAKADKWLETGTEDMRFDQAWQIYLADQQERNSRSAVIKAEQYYRLYLEPEIKTRKLSSITPAMWQRCINAAGSKGLSERTCANIRQVISSFVLFALRSRWDVQRLEKGDLTIPKSAAPVKPKTVLQPDEIRILFSDSTFPHYGKQVQAHYIYAWRFLVVTGLRRGELCGLRNEDIDGRLLTVNRSINSLNEITGGKNRNARRTIELTDIAMQILSDQRAYLASLSLISPWVFPSPDGQPNPNQLYDHWATYRKHHGLTSSLHELRHTFISLGKADLPLELMKAVVGHSASMDTFAVYGHEISSDRHRAAQIIDNVFKDILK